MSHCGECGIRRASEMGRSVRLSTGSSKLDESLSGGLPVKGITEICGESGSGKSQICLQLALTAQLPLELGGLHGGVIYICSEELFQSKRLQQMIDALKAKLQTTIKFSDNIYILHVADYASLENNFRNILQLVRNRNIKLLILDSITAVFRGNLTDGGGRRRAADLRKIASTFYELNGKYGVMIVCVNQAKLSQLFPKCKIVVEKKADSLYPVVGAASICAKVIRDNVVQNWRFPEAIEVPENDFGTGYPGDPKSKQFLTENKDDVFGFPNLVRFSWSTADKLLEDVTQVEWEEENDGSRPENKISKFFTERVVSGEAKHQLVGKFFKERSLTAADKF